MLVAAPGRTVVAPRAVKTCGGGKPFMQRGAGVQLEDGSVTAEADPPAEWPDVFFVRQRVRAGDLLVAPANMRATPSPDMAHRAPTATAARAVKE